MKILIATKNPGKVEATKQAFSKYFHSDEINIEQVGDIDTGVGRQPVNEETLQGAKNRVDNLYQYTIDNKIGYDFLVANESGITNQLGCWAIISAAVVKDKEGNQGIGFSSAFQAPEKYVERIKNTSLGTVMDEIFDTENSADHNGGISELTKGKISRIDLVRASFMMALVPLLNKELYGQESDIANTSEKLPLR